MAKQRNSLGFLVLPTTGEVTITWEQYKERTGIDLDKLFKIENIGSDDSPMYKISVRETCRKIIAISCGDTESAGLPPVMIPNLIVFFNTESVSGALIDFQCSDRDVDAGYHLRVNADKTIWGGQL